jgi:hypothetical protein
MTSHALMVKRLLEVGLRFPVVAGETFDVFCISLQLTFVQHILSIFIPVVALKALKDLHMKRMLKCDGGALFALKQIGIIEKDLFRLPERNGGATENYSKNREDRLPYPFCYPTHLPNPFYPISVFAVTGLS